MIFLKDTVWFNHVKNLKCEAVSILVKRVPRGRSTCYNQLCEKAFSFHSSPIVLSLFPHINKTLLSLVAPYLFFRSLHVHPSLISAAPCVHAVALLTIVMIGGALIARFLTRFVHIRIQLHVQIYEFLSYPSSYTSFYGKKDCAYEHWRLNMYRCLINCGARQAWL